MSEIDPVIEPKGEEQGAQSASAESARHPEAAQTAKDLSGEDRPSQPRPFAVSAAQGDAAARSRKSRAGIFILGAFSGCAILFVALFFFALLAALAGNDSGEARWASEKVAVIPIEGEILDAREAVEALHKYASNSTVKAIVMRINSPGGAIAPSQEIYEEIRKTRERSGKPIIASLDSVAASGGFYIAAACDEIIANPGSITGSIGVILQWMDLKELLAWAKLKPETITSGTLKAAGSPYQELSDAERAYLQRIVQQLHGQFVKAVAEGRKGKISADDVAKIADGRVFTGEEALTLKLVDRLGNLDDAVGAAGRMGGIKGTPAMLYPKRKKGGLLDILTDESETETMLERVISRRLPRFLYRW